MSEPKRGRGRPRTKSKPGEPWSDGQAALKFRVPDEVAAYVREKPRGWLLEIVMREMSREAL